MAQGFESKTYSFFEAAHGHGTPLAVQVSRIGGSSGMVSCTVKLVVDYMPPLGAIQAQPRADFDFDAQSFEWRDGELGAKDVHLDIRDNNAYEGIDKCIALQINVTAGGAVARKPV